MTQKWKMVPTSEMIESGARAMALEEDYHWTKMADALPKISVEYAPVELMQTRNWWRTHAEVCLTAALREAPAPTDSDIRRRVVEECAAIIDEECAKQEHTRAHVLSSINERIRSLSPQPASPQGEVGELVRELREQAEFYRHRYVSEDAIPALDAMTKRECTALANLFNRVAAALSPTEQREGTR